MLPKHNNNLSVNTYCWLTVLSRWLLFLNLRHASIFSHFYPLSGVSYICVLLTSLQTVSRWCTVGCGPVHTCMFWFCKVCVSSVLNSVSCFLLICICLIERSFYVSVCINFPMCSLIMPLNGISFTKVTLLILGNLCPVFIDSMCSTQISRTYGKM